jgi:hypothetical protein
MYLNKFVTLRFTNLIQFKFKSNCWEELEIKNRFLGFNVFIFMTSTIIMQFIIKWFQFRNHINQNGILNHLND